MSLIKRVFSKLKRNAHAAIAAVMVMSQIAAPIALLSTTPALAITGTVIDTAGANDEPGQKDLTQLFLDDTGLPTSVHAVWNWDETGTNGANTLDGCALFDSDGDGFVNYAACVTTTGDPAVISATTLYSCGDDKADRCTSPATAIASPYVTSCTVTQESTDPFPGPAQKDKGDDYPVDTVADCTIVLSDFSAADLVLVDVCSYPSAQPNSDPSDCVILRTKSGKLEVQKVLDPASDPGLFNLQIDSVTQAPNVGNGGTTGEVVVEVGDHTVGETAGTATSLSSYSTAIECRDLNGTGSVIASSTNPTVSVSVVDNSDVVCVITNSLQLATLTLEKNLPNDDGGDATQANFTPLLNGLSTIQTQPVAWDTPLSLTAGTYTASEQLPLISGYSMTDVSCHVTGNLAEPVPHPVILAPGGAITCVVTNDDVAPGLTLIKDVVGPGDQTWDGGTAVPSDFTLILNSSDGAYDDSEYSTGATPTVKANTTYTLSEDDDVAGYELTNIECRDDITDALVGSFAAANDNYSFSLDEGQNVTCTVFNDDISPKLIIQKVLLDANADGGTLTVDDFYVTLDTNLQVMTTGTTGEITSTAGLHVIREDLDQEADGTPLSGYEFVELGAGSSDACILQGIDGNGDPTINITLQVGVTYTCVLVNDDIAPTLTLVKQVEEDAGGNTLPSAWTLMAQDPSGAYLINEAGVNDASSDPATATTTTYEAIAGVTYTLDEDGPGGYEASLWSCDGGNLIGADLTMALDEDVTCTVINRDIAPTLTLQKTVVNDNGGDADPSNWTLSASQNNNIVVAGTPYIDVSSSVNTKTESIGSSTISAGVYTLNEYNGPTGYTASAWDCVGGGQLDGNELTIGLDEDVICTITNNDKEPSLTVIKRAINNNGGDVLAPAFEMTLNTDPIGPPDSAISSISANGDTDSKAFYEIDDVVANKTYTVSEVEKFGYKNLGVVCEDDNTQSTLSHPLVLNEGQSATCTLTNDDIAPALTVIKITQTIDPDPAQYFNIFVDLPDDAQDFGFTLDNHSSDDFQDSVTINSAGELIRAGDITLTEIVPDGWQISSITCYPTQDGPLIGRVYNQASYDFTLEPGDDVTCEFVNTEQSDIEVTKYWDINQNGQRDDGEELLEDWTFNLEQCAYLNGTTAIAQQNFGGLLPCDPFTLNNQTTLSQVTDSNGTTVFENLDSENYYVLSEEIKPGWNLSDINCWYQTHQGPGFGLGLNRYFIHPAPGETVQCEVGNYQDANLLIEKTNDASSDLLPSDMVDYTITVSNPVDSGVIHDAIVHDTLPANFDFTGSYSVVSSLLGDITSSVTASYTDGVGTWQIGNLAVGEIVAITYEVQVGADVEPGVYDNVAFVEAGACMNFFLLGDDVFSQTALRTVNNDQEEHENPCPEGSYLTPLLGNVEEFEVDSPFVSSSVAVTTAPPTQGFVLGVLTVTGSPAILTTSIGISILLATAGITLSRSRRFKRLFNSALRHGQYLSLALVFTTMLSSSVFAVSTPFWQLSVTDLPATVTSDSVDIGYSLSTVFADADTNDDFKVTLYQDGTEIDSDSFDADYGKNGEFTVSGLADGTYDFKVLASSINSGSDDQMFEQTVAVDSTAPAAPDYNGVERAGNVYTLSFTAGSDAHKVLIYASSSTEFNADSSTLVGEVAVGGSSFVYTAPDGAQRYFALQTEDAAGNRSALVGDEEIVTIGGGLGSTDTNGVVASDVSDSNGIVGDSAATDSNIASDSEGAAQGATDDTTTDEDSSGSSLWPTVGVLLVAVGVLYYLSGLRKEES